MSTLGPAYSLIGMVDEDLEGDFGCIGGPAGRVPLPAVTPHIQKAMAIAASSSDGSWILQLKGSNQRNPVKRADMIRLSQRGVYYRNGQWYGNNDALSNDDATWKNLQLWRTHDTPPPPDKSILGKVTRTVGSVTKTVGNTIGDVPIAGDVARFVGQQASFVSTPFRMGAGFVTGMATGGLSGAVEGAKKQAEVTMREGKRYLASPLIRQGTKGLALLFPPLAPVAAGVEAANQLIKAIDSGDPLAAAAAVATIATTTELAALGNPEAIAGMKYINDAKDVLGSKLPALPVQAAKLGARFAPPPGATVEQSIRAADSLLDDAGGIRGKVAKDTANSLIKQTVTAAKAGDPSAIMGATILKKVRGAQLAKLAAKVRR